MPRGRPRKNPLPIQQQQDSLIEPIEQIDQSEKPNLEDQLEKLADHLDELDEFDAQQKEDGRTKRAQEKKVESLPRCNLCSDTIKVTPYSINTEFAFGIAGWHREMPTRIKLCPKCARKFSDEMDKWWFDNGGKSKFDVPFVDNSK